MLPRTLRGGLYEAAPVTSCRTRRAIVSVRNGTPLSDVVENPRRAPRVRARGTVEIRHRLARWHAAVEDLGPGGLQIVSPRILPRGREVRVALHIESLRRSIEGRGVIRWTRPAAPARLGLAFEPDGPGRGFFDELVSRDRGLATAARSSRRSLSGAQLLYPGEPPHHILDFGPDELALLQRVGSSTTVRTLVRSFGDEAERVHGALFGLLARRLLVTDRASSPGPGPWRAVLAEAALTHAVASLDAPAPAPRRCPPAQHLLDEALRALARGSLAIAALRLEEALGLAPADPELLSHLSRIAPWV